MSRCAVRMFVVASVLAGLSAVNVSADSAEDALALAQRTLAYVERSGKCPAMTAELATLATRLPQAKEAAARAALEKDIRALRRRILFSHPALAFDRLMISQRTLPYSCNAHMVDQYPGRYSRPGPGIAVLENWKSAPRKIEPLKGKLPLGTVLNPDLHWDGDRVIFAFCDHTAVRTPAEEGVVVPTLAEMAKRGKSECGDAVRALDPDNPCFSDKAKGYDVNPTAHLRYFIWEAALDGSWVRQLTGTPRDPLKTWCGRQSVLVEDVDPCYLPDGGFAFTSTRCQGFGRCHWGRYAPSFLLYRAEGDGSNIRQLSYGEANEWEPSVLNDGRLVYTRWDYINRNEMWLQSLWTTNPDGTGTAHFYGNYTRHPCIQTEAKAIPGSHVVIATAAAHHFITAGSLITIDTHKGEDGPAPLTRVTPEIVWPESEKWGQPGCYANPFPLNDTLFLASFSPDKVEWKGKNGEYHGAWPRNNAFGIWLVDTLGGRELIYQDEAIGSFSPMPVLKRPHPPVIPSRLPPPEHAPDYGVCYVQNVYDCREPLEKGSVKYVRLNQILNQPTAEKAVRGSVFTELPKRPLGIVPVADDGSASFRIPTGMPVQLQALNADGMAVMTMRSFIYAHDGELIGCVGCHENKTRSVPPQVTKSREIALPQPTPVLGYAGGFSFMRTVQPVFDRHCIRCHGLGDMDKKCPNLVGPGAYGELIKRKMISQAEWYKETDASKPKDYFAVVSPLTALLKKGHQGVVLTKADWDALIVWMDLNAPQYGDYGFNREDQRQADPEGEKRLRAEIEARFGKAVAAQPFHALVNVGQPEKSRILLAALPLAAGGWGQLEDGYQGTNDSAYQTMLTLVLQAIKPLAYQDFCGTCGRGKECVCQSCWVWMGRFNEPASGSDKRVTATR